MYGDPMEVYAAKQAREKRKTESPAPKRHTLTLKSRKMDGEWSDARKAAEALFDFPAGAGAVSAVPCPTPSAMRVELAD
jgi:hypothetical protein